MKPALWVSTGLCALIGTAAWAEMPAPLTNADYTTIDEAEARLGRDLFYDPILSGNRNISCATCHHPDFATGDGLSLGMGEGGIGLGPARHPDPNNLPEQRIPRNSPALFNLGATQFTRLFHDGRVEQDPKHANGLRTPLEDDMVTGFSGILSAQNMFPVLSPDEMAGHYQENDVSKAVRSGRITGPGGAWDIIAQRVWAIPSYRIRFEALHPELTTGAPLTFPQISNAIAAFVAEEWRSDTSPFDAALRGETPLSPEAQAGVDLFYGDAGCSSCHAGVLQTDHDFHAMAAPQLGPGKAERFENHSRDEGRMRVTGNPKDRFAFRTPSLRNVMKTGPWGHAGGATDLTAFLRGHGQPESLAAYTATATLPAFPKTKPDWAILEDPSEMAAIEAASLHTRPLSEAEIPQILAFLDSLTDPTAIKGRLGVPDSVPSGLKMDK